jgi:hypothetical protein
MGLSVVCEDYRAIKNVVVTESSQRTSALELRLYSVKGVIHAAYTGTCQPVAVSGALTILTSTASTMTASPAHASDWRNHRQEQGCEQTCRSYGQQPVSSGTYSVDGGTYYVCIAGFTDNDQPGYNLSTWNSDRCVAGWNGGEEAIKSFFWCLCQ